MAQTRLITWDWKDTIDISQLDEAIQSLPPLQGVHVYDVPNTGGDLYACVIANGALNPAEVEAAYERHMEDDD